MLTGNAQVNIKVSVSEISVASTLNCDPDGADSSNFLFEFMAVDNSHFGYSNNSPVSGSIGPCNYAYVPENNGPFTLTPSAPGTATFNPGNGLFFDRLYSCRHDVPTALTVTWRAYESDDLSVPTVTAVANGQTAIQTNTFSIPATSGTYSVQYTAASVDGACPQTYSIKFSVVRSTGSFTPLSITDLDGSVVCTGASNGHAGATVSGGSGTVLYDWSNDGVGEFDDSTAAINLTVGTYTLVVKDGLNCTDTARGTVTALDPPMPVNFTASASPICTGQPYLFSVNSQTTTAVYNWSYSTGGLIISSAANNATVTALPTAASGTLSVFAQNSCSATAAATVAVVVNQTPSITVNGNTTICDNSQETLNASGASTYTWSTGANSPSITVAPLSTTIYTISGSSNGCTGMSTFTLNTIPSPTFQISGPSAAICPGQTVTASTSGNGVNYIWSDGFVGASHTFSGTATVIYTVTATYTNSCFSQQTYTLNVNPSPTVAIAGSASVCAGSVSSYSASGANTYTWNTAGTGPVTTLTVTSPSTLLVTGTNTLTGCSNTATYSVQLYPQPNLVISGNKYVCSGQPTVLTASGADFYLWNSGATANTETVTLSVTSTITVVGTNINGGCHDSTSVVVNVTSQPTITVTGADSACKGQPVVLAASGAPNYSWSTGAVTPSITVTPSVTTTYTVSSMNGSCSGTQTHQVVVKPLPVIDFAISSACVNDPPFVLNATPMGGTYSGPGISGNMFDPQLAGAGLFIITYSVTNNYGCSATTQSTVEVLTCTGVQNLTNESGVNIFPNPGNGLVQVQSSKTIREIIVSDASGRLVKIIEGNAVTATVDISNEVPGLYLFDIRLEGNIHKHYKIIRQ